MSVTAGMHGSAEFGWLFELIVLKSDFIMQLLFIPTQELHWFLPVLFYSTLTLTMIWTEK